MDNTSEYAQVVANREQFYKFLARLYKVETDQPLLDSLTKLRFPSSTRDDQLTQGYRLLEGFLQEPGLDPLTDLAADYARVFLGAGIAKEDTAAYPYESVYTSPEHLIMQEARDQVLACYRSKGLDKDECVDFPEDHVALEMEFMAHMCGESGQALKKGDLAAATESLVEQRDFLERHLLNWTPDFCEDIRKCAVTAFYQGLSRLTDGFLAMDRTVLNDLIQDTMGEAA